MLHGYNFPCFTCIANTSFKILNWIQTVTSTMFAPSTDNFYISSIGCAGSFKYYNKSKFRIVQMPAMGGTLTFKNINHYHFFLMTNVTYGLSHYTRQKFF